MPEGAQVQKPLPRWSAAIFVFGPTVFVVGAALGDWAFKPPRGWIGAELIIIIALLTGKQFYRKRLQNA